MTKRTLLAGGLAAVLLLAALGGLLVRSRASAARAEAQRAEALLGQAREIVETARREKLLEHAAASFAAVEKRIESGRGLLLGGQPAKASAEGEAAVREAKAAADEARGKVPASRSALLHALRNKVLYRQAEGVAWAAATAQMSLYDQDRIATKEKSEAIVRFNEGNEMRIEENSVMVVERMLESKVDTSLSMTLTVPQGAVRTHVARDHDRDVRVVINLPRAVVSLDTATLARGTAEVGTRVHPDSSNRIAVYTGEAEVVAPSGVKVVVRQNQYAEVTPKGELTAVKDLPASGIILLPGRNATVYISSSRPEVTFKWKATGTCAKFRLQVATDPQFLDRLVDVTVPRTRFTYGNLRAGKYLWRMACLDERGVEGGWSETSAFEVAVDNDAPRLAVLAPAENLVTTASSVLARCRTEAGVAVFINGIEASSGAGGEYSKDVPLERGINTLVFEAVDAAGNVIYNSLLVTRK